MNSTKTIITLSFIVILSSMVFIFSYFGNKPLNHTEEPNPDWSQISLNDETERHTYITYQMMCSKCHGTVFKGNFRGPALNDKEWIHGSSKEAIYSIISNGSPNGKMRGWKKKITIEDMQKLSLFIESLQKKTN